MTPEQIAGSTFADEKLSDAAFIREYAAHVPKEFPLQKRRLEGIARRLELLQRLVIVLRELDHVMIWPDATERDKTPKSGVLRDQDPSADSS